MGASMVRLTNNRIEIFRSSHDGKARGEVSLGSDCRVDFTRDSAMVGGRSLYQFTIFTEGEDAMGNAWIGGSVLLLASPSRDLAEKWVTAVHARVCVS